MHCHSLAVASPHRLLLPGGSCRLFAAVLAAAGVLSAQTTWSAPILVNPSPGAREGFAMASAPAGPFNAPIVLLFGGFDGTRLNNETWLFDTATNSWALLATNPTPSPREGHVLAFDPTVNAIVLHGGRTTGVPNATGHGNQALNDLWQFNLSNMSWQQLQLFPGRQGPLLHDHAMVFDPRHDFGFGPVGALTIYGGHQNIVNGTPMGDEMFLMRNGFGGLSGWVIDGTVTQSPAGRVRHAMVFDANRGRVVMFGGRILQGATLVPTAEFWEFDSTVFLGAWTLQTPSPTLFPTHGAEMVFDPVRGRTIFFGNAAAPTGAPTMEFDGTFLQRVNVPGLQTTGRGFAFDFASRRAVFFAGANSNVTATYGPSPASSLAQFGATNGGNGAACRFANGTLPVLDKAAMLEWQIGTTRNLGVSTLPPQNELVFVLASLSQANPPIAVPNAPGCFQLIGNPTETLPMVVTGGQPSVQVPVTIPNNPAFLGFHVFHQALVTDASSPRGFALTNATDMVIGAM